MGSTRREKGVRSIRREKGVGSTRREKGVGSTRREKGVGEHEKGARGEEEGVQVFISIIAQI